MTDAMHMKMSKIKFVWIPIVVLVAFCIWESTKEAVCRFPASKVFAISCVDYGPFIEWVPVKGAFLRDTIAHTHKVRVEIDRMYDGRVTTGMMATTRVKDSTYALVLACVHADVDGDRITVDMKFTDAIPSIRDNESLRLRLELSKPADAILVATGGFYYDTKGKWIYVINEGVAVKRDVQLGRKNSDYFEVIEGLKPGEHVISSSYEPFKGQDSVKLKSTSELKVL